jgi:hypothetical protein
MLHHLQLIHSLQLTPKSKNIGRLCVILWRHKKANASNVSPK